MRGKGDALDGRREIGTLCPFAILEITVRCSTCAGPPDPTTPAPERFPPGVIIAVIKAHPENSLLLGGKPPSDWLGAVQGST
jgi:hypothetical protein